MSQEDAPQEGQEPAATESDAPVVEQKFDADYVKTLRSEAARNRKEAQEAKAKVQELEERDQSELEKLTGKLTKAEQERADAQSRLLRFEVASEKQVPPDAVDLLSAGTREELEAQADKILSFTAKPEVTPDFDGGAREPAPEPKTPAEAHNELAVAIFGERSN